MGFICEQWGWSSPRTIPGVGQTRCLFLGSCNLDSLSGILPVFHSWFMKINLIGWWLPGNGPESRHNAFSASQILKSRTSVWHAIYWSTLQNALKSLFPSLARLGTKFGRYCPIHSLHLCCLEDRKIENRKSNQTKLQKVMSELPPFVRQNIFSGEIFPSPSCHAHPIPHLESSYTHFIK